MASKTTYTCDVCRTEETEMQFSGRWVFKVGEKCVVVSPHLDTCKRCLRRATQAMEAFFLAFGVKVETAR